MPSVNIRRPLYDALIKNDEEPADVANDLVEGYLEDEHGVEVDL